MILAEETCWCTAGRNVLIFVRFSSLSLSMPDMHSYLNLYPCVIKVQSINQSINYINQSLSLSLNARHAFVPKPLSLHKFNQSINQSIESVSQSLSLSLSLSHAGQTLKVIVIVGKDPTSPASNDFRES